MLIATKTNEEYSQVMCNTPEHGHNEDGGGGGGGGGAQWGTIMTFAKKSTFSNTSFKGLFKLKIVWTIQNFFNYANITFL